MKGTTSKSGLARVTSYNKLERKVEEVDDDDYSQPSSSRIDSQRQYMKGAAGEEEQYRENLVMKNQDL